MWVLDVAKDIKPSTFSAGIFSPATNVVWFSFEMNSFFPVTLKCYFSSLSLFVLGLESLQQSQTVFLPFLL